MIAEETIYAALVASAGVTALVQERIYTRLVPVEKVLPSIAFRRTETEYLTTIHSGSAIAGKAVVEIACMGSTAEQCETVANAVLDALGISGHAAINRSQEEDLELGTWASIIVVNVWE